jgi:membrane associated rhomboid family serine protease
MFFLIPLEMRCLRPRASVPVANYFLIGLNVVLFLLGWQWAVGPGTGLLSVLLYGFSHVGFWHLLINMWMLWVFGNPANRRIGNGYYLMAYLGTILVLGLLAKLATGVCLAGSSGAIFAVMVIALMLMPAALIEVGYMVLFPLSLIVGLFSRPKYGLYWFIRAGTFGIKAVWCLALIPLLELWAFIWSGWSFTNLAHLLGMVCGLVVVLMLPAQISMGRRTAAEAF